MTLFLNDERIDTPSTILLQLMKEIQLDQKSGIAVAVNGKVISKHIWDKIELIENDRVLIITASAGG